MAKHNTKVTAQTLTQKAGTAIKSKRRPFLPRTRQGWLLTVSIITVIVLASLGWLTNGRAGLVSVTGNSMSSVMPLGSSVITFPLSPREGDYVVALAGAPDDQSDTTRGDDSLSLVVKRYHNGRLVSTDDTNVYSHYEHRGRVIARIPTQKILWWRDKGVQKATIDPPSLDQRIMANVMDINARAEEQRKLKEQLVGATKIISSPKAVGDGNLSNAYLMQRGETINIAASKPVSRIIVWLSGDDLAKINGQELRPNGSFVTTELPVPTPQLTVMCVASTPCAPPGLVIKEIVLH